MTSHSDQPTYGWTPSRQTSHEAYESVRPVLSAIQYKVVAALADADRTDDEIESMTGLSHQTASATRRGLVKAGRVEATGDRRPTRTGRMAQVWRLTR